MRKITLFSLLLLICALTACDISNLPMTDNCDHSFTVVASILPTCTKAGDSTLKCNKCDYSEKTQISALGHSYVETQNAEGVSIEYTCRNCSDSYTSWLLPSVITAESFDKYIAMPLIEEYTSLVNEYTNGGYDFFNDTNYTAYAPGNIINLKGYAEAKSVLSDVYHKGFIDFVKATKDIAYAELGINSAEYKEIAKLASDIEELVFRYYLMNPVNEKAAIETYKKFLKNDKNDTIAANVQLLVNQCQQMLDDMYAVCPITKEDVAVYKWDNVRWGDPAIMIHFSKIISAYCPEFDFNVKYEVEKLSLGNSESK